MELRTFSKIPGVSRTHPATSMILPTKSSGFSTGVSYTSSFKNNHKKNSTEDRPGDRGYHATDPPRPIQPPGKVAYRCALNFCTEMYWSAIVEIECVEEWVSEHYSAFLAEPLGRMLDTWNRLVSLVECMDQVNSLLQW